MAGWLTQPAYSFPIVHSPLWDVSYHRVCKIEKGRDWSYRPFRVSKGNFLKSENRTSGSLKNELLSCSEKGCQLKWHPFRALMPGCKLCFFGRFYVSPQISRKNGENKLHLEVYLYCSGKRTSPQLRPFVFPNALVLQRMDKKTRIKQKAMWKRPHNRISRCFVLFLTLRTIFGYITNLAIVMEFGNDSQVFTWAMKKKEPGYWHMTFIGIN